MLQVKRPAPTAIALIFALALFAVVLDVVAGAMPPRVVLAGGSWSWVVRRVLRVDGCNRWF